MSESARTAYRRFATFFLVVGGVFLLLGVLRATLLPDVVRGDPTQVALLLLAIGGALRWTVRRRLDDGEGADEPADEAPDDPPRDDAPPRAEPDADRPDADRPDADRPDRR